MMKHDETYEDRPCEECGAPMHVAKKSTQRFCSYACQSAWQKKRVGELNPKYNHIKIVCDYCGVEYMETPYKVNAPQKHFCSKQCRQAWYREIWSQRDEWRNESAIRAVKHMISNPVTNTKPQQIVNQILDVLDIKYDNEHVVGHYAIDNYLTDADLFIEVMGDYWHCNRKKYQKIMYANQKDSIRRDRAKHTYVKRYHKKEILYLWESDIIDRMDVVEKLITAYVCNDGVLDNYHSMNYDLVDDILVCRNDILTYQDMDHDELKEYYNAAS